MMYLDVWHAQSLSMLAQASPLYAAVHQGLLQVNETTLYGEALHNRPLMHMFDYVDKVRQLLV